ncbi:MAG: ATP-dependent RNA helicase DbpA [Pseudomonadota bacterium]|nr:ATP-dependent RNA helicase DbpA [Pseudomonadota bacterium]
MPTFTEIATLPPALVQATDTLGYTALTEIQAAALPSMLARRDVIAQALTGSGKTAAFGLALLALLQPQQIRLQSLVLCPTRELADQVSKEIRALARFIPNVKVLTLCGGIPVGAQLASLAHEPHVVVGTPGRILDLCRKEALRFDALQTVVLDEADRMLDMGFLDDVSAILALTPDTRNTWFFSATYPPEINALSARFQKDALSVTVERRHDATAIEQLFYRVDSEDKPVTVLTLLRQRQPDSCLVFCNTKVDVKALTDFLWKHDVPALALHGDLEQRDRDETLVQFANGSCRVLVATDVAARGLDIKALPLVIACELPHDAEVHTHRIGRTGRAGASGVAITLVAPDEMKRVERVETMLGTELTWSELPRTGGTALPAPAMRTLAIDAGRQDKLRPGDIVGALTNAAGLRKEQIGKIDVFATRSYVAVERALADKVREKLRAEKIKGRSFRVRSL